MGCSSGKLPKIHTEADLVFADLNTFEGRIAFALQGVSETVVAERTENIIIFDWDDTLFPTSWARRCVGHPVTDAPLAPRLTSQQTEDLASLSELVTTTLRAAQAIGEVVILTNSTRTWVDICCEELMPEVMPAIADLPVNYAMENMTSDERAGQAGGAVLTEAKFRAMRALLSTLFVGVTPRNLVSIGDSRHEHEAVRRVSQHGACSSVDSGRCRTKTIKMVGRPTLSQIIAQLTVMSRWLSDIVQIDSDLGIELG